MKKPFLTVIIPTFNRSTCLDECLRHLKNQSLKSSEFDVIVVNDGSTDDTKKLLKKWEADWRQLSAINQKNTGQGIARNKALKLARGEIVLFIGDDIYGQKDFLKTHYDFHKKNPQKNKACLGKTVWDPRKRTTDYMMWLTHGGPQFAYDKLEANKEASFWFFYTSNISLKKTLLEKEAFDPAYRGYGWEDIELAYRLKKSSNLKIIFKSKAFAYHDHYMESSSLKKRMISIGKNTHVFQDRHPELNLIPRGLKRLALILIASPIVVLPAKLLSKRIYWYALSKRYFMKGLRSV